MSEWGGSAGRSAKNPVNGRRRFTDDERAKNVHQADDPNQWPDREREIMSIQEGMLALVIRWILAVLYVGVAATFVHKGGGWEVGAWTTLVWVVAASFRKR